MDGMDYVRSSELPWMQFDKLSFRNYFPKEIEKLSVLCINQTKTFDDIGHAVRGGLYDPLLGPGESFDKCETCHQFELYCPGHVGHIRLDLPVFNPVLFSFTFNLLKGSCVQCHRLTCNSDSLPSRLLLAQLRCFDYGLPHLALELESILKDHLKDLSDVLHASPEEELQMMAEIDKLIAEKAGGPLSTLSKGEPAKNCVKLKMHVVKNFLKLHLFKRRERCPLCKGKNGKLTNDKQQCVIINFVSAAENKKKINLYATGDFEQEQSDDENKDENNQGENEGNLLGYGGMNVSEGSLDQQMEAVRQGSCDKLAWRAAEIREHFRLVFKNDGRLLSKLFPMFDDAGAAGLCPLDGLFCELIVVPPIKFRPIRVYQGQRYEDPQTVNLRKVLEATETIKAVSLVMRGENSSSLMELIAHRLIGKSINAKMHNAYLTLQMRVNTIYDGDLDTSAVADGQKTPGIKQILEKKQGLFRMNMMGKRVNFACRSVITPDPYLDVDEIGIPEVFAKKLTFTEPVNLYNTNYLRDLVKAGPNKYPGANFIVQHNSKKVKISDAEDGKDARVAMARQLQPANSGNLRQPLKVLRHLRKGDMMMMNRQPSLHKPSIMGHRARVLTGQRALRMNYAPCKAYNADFDGDEMNGHLVQTHIAQCEVSEIASVGNNLLVPKDATPLLGLIQDHVVSGVLLTLRGRFLNKEDFMHLVLAAFAETSDRIELPPPCMLKPQRLWSGKQVITCIMQNCIPKDKPRINLSGKAKTPLSCWKVQGYSTPEFNMSESEVIIREGELLVGVLDKAHYGATQFGLVHCCFELYGSRIGVKVISCFSRLFTTYLQFHGFTLGVADILVREEANKERKKAVRELRTIGDQVVRSTFGLDENCSRNEITRILASAYCSPRGPGIDVKMLDFGMKQGVAKYNDAINGACVPEGLIRSFPENALQMMILSGAKGSSVNAIQISCCLGQIELEGKRMAVTIAGRTLPSFKAFDTSPRAGGYIDQRFLTGINPQELFFHTMAGREGLIDTAVKTSRSGYLQRCIIKHLEGIKVHYDATVRDHDGSIIQFRYGEDGMDTAKSSFLNPKTLPFIRDNLEAVSLCSRPDNMNDKDFNIVKSQKQYQKIRKWRRKADKRDGGERKVYRSGFAEFAEEHVGTEKGVIVGLWHEKTAEEKREYEKNARKPCPTAVDEKFNVNRTLGALPEKLLDQIEGFVGDSSDRLKSVLYWKGMRSAADPGENVGLLAAQSIGEPSTQMTLNTFHFAGRGEMNVTLGIPRLREILMTESKNIATPSAQIAVLPGTSNDRIERIKEQLDRVYLKQVLKNFTIKDCVNLTDRESWRRYTIRLNILSAKKRELGSRHLKRSFIMKELEGRFIRGVAKSIDGKLRSIAEYQHLQSRKLRSGNLSAGLGQDSGTATVRRAAIDDGASSDEEGGRDNDAGEKRLQDRHNDEAAEYVGEEEDKVVEQEVVELEEDSEKEDEDAARKTTEEGEEGQAQEGEKDGVKPKDSRKESADARIRRVLGLADMIVGYNYDTQAERWCEIVYQVPLSSKTKLDLTTILEKEVGSFIVHQTPGIERCVERTETKEGKDVLYLQTQGINLQALFVHSEVLDVNSVQMNDLDLVLRVYGIEACAMSIVNEMNNVFAVYGIEVSKRHLSLTADYMTFTGCIGPFNRGAMSSSASPLQKMTFETTMAFLKEALIHGEDDHLHSPSARLVVGSLNRGGTGSFDLLLEPSYST